MMASSPLSLSLFHGSSSLQFRDSFPRSFEAVLVVLNVTTSHNVVFRSFI